MRKAIFILFISASFLFLWACGEEEPKEMVELDETPYVFEYGNLSAPDLPDDNVLTQRGVRLGRMLFYEKMLSKDGTQACASCHRQEDAFSDINRFSIGVELLPGNRQAMSVFNMAWHSNGFFWDGRSELLRHQSLKPIEDPLEMNETLDNVIAKLSASQEYQDQFTRAFGTDEVNADKIALALEQFMMSIVSYNSKYDQSLVGEVELTESEERGRILFEAEYNPFFPEVSGADCAHCHGGANFENDQYMNNGLDADGKMDDIGYEAVTLDPADKGKFKVPSLRNIALTPPYMHDGRFQTLEEVVDHYDLHVKMSSTLDPTLIQVAVDGGLKLTAQDKVDLVNFMKTLSDETLQTDPRYSSPF